MSSSTSSATSPEGTETVRHRIAHAIGHSPRVLVISAVACALAVGMLLGVGVQRVWLEPDQWNPLGEYAVQRVTSRDVPDVHGPSAYAPGFVEVVATKCNATNHEVRVKGSSAWQRIDPPFAQYKNASGTATRLPGCTTTDYQNDIPEPVIEATRRVGGRATWRITGIETPIRPNGEQGEERVWEAQNFVVVIR